MSKAKSVVYSDEKAKLALAKKEYIKLGDKRGTLRTFFLCDVFYNI